MAFFKCCEFSPFKPSTKEWGLSTSIEKKNDSHFFQSSLDFLAHVEDFFHPPSLVITLEPSILIHNPTLKPLFLQ
jgi:hypothetical protein